MRNLFCPGFGIVCSSVLIIFGLFFLFVFPSIQKVLTAKELHLSPFSKSFKHWHKTPIAITMDFYLFNWTNPNDFELKKKPAFTELGPYRFYETRVKVNVTWNDNGTVSYRQMSTWHFRANESKGSLDDMVTSVNPVSLTAANIMRDANFIEKSQLNLVFNLFGEKVATTQSVRDLLFNGYPENMMRAVNTFPTFSPITSPFDKFGWFYSRNNSFTMNGWFNLDTGVQDISRLGKVRRWNHKNYTGFYEGECGRVDGFSGDMYPPGHIKQDSRISIFSQDLCRAVPLEYANDTEVKSIAGYKFVASLREKDDGSCDPKGSCSCNGECVPSGFLNLTACRYGAPVFVSFPHFYDASPTYLNMVKGLKPEKEKHEFYVTIEPTYGIPVDVGARAQLNVLMKPIDHIYMYRRAPRLMMPVLWVDQRARISEPLAKELRLVILIPVLVTAFGVFALSLGTLLIVVTLVYRARTRLTDKRMVKQIIDQSLISVTTGPRKSLSLSTKLS